MVLVGGWRADGIRLTVVCSLYWYCTLSFVLHGCVALKKSNESVSSSSSIDFLVSNIIFNNKLLLSRMITMYYYGAEKKFRFPLSRPLPFLLLFC